MTKINNRPIFFCFLAFGLGIYFARPIFNFNLWICIFCFLGMLAISYLCIKHKCIKRLALILVAFGLGVLTFFISYKSFGSKKFGVGEQLISGRVSITTAYESSQNVIIDNVYVNGKKIKQNIKVFVYDETGFEVGDILTFSAQITNAQVFVLGKFNSYAYKYNIPYECSVNAKDIILDSKNNKTWSEKLKQSVLGVLNKNMSAEQAGVSYASLFGDKSYIPQNVKESFSVGGVAHLLAVSGLHIGFAAAFLSFILKKLKVNKYATFSIIFVVLGLYAYICAFSASVIRAALMYILMELASIIGKRYERLNAWSLAGIICLLYKPLYVFDGGFLLSFACVFCIFMFAKSFEQTFTKWHFPKFLKTSLSVIIPVQFGILPIISNYFSKTSLLSILANLICVPIFEIFFISLFAVVPIILILPALKFLLFIPKIIISAIIWFAQTVGGAKWAIINLSKITGILVVAIYAILFIISHYTNITKKQKILSSFCITLIAILLTGVMGIPQKPQNNQITILNNYNKIVYFLELENKTFAISNLNEYTSQKLQDYLDYSNHYLVDYCISLNGNLIKNNKSIKNIFTCGQTEGEKQLQYNKFYNLSGVQICAVKVAQSFAGLYIKTKSTTIFVFSDQSLNYGQYIEIAYLYENVDIIIGKDKQVNKLAEYINYGCLIANGSSLIYNQQTYYPPGTDFSFEFKNNNVINMRGVN